MIWGASYVFFLPIYATSSRSSQLARCATTETDQHLLLSVCPKLAVCSQSFLPGAVLADAPNHSLNQFDRPLPRYYDLRPPSCQVRTCILVAAAGPSISNHRTNREYTHSRFKNTRDADRRIECGKPKYIKKKEKIGYVPFKFHEFKKKKKLKHHPKSEQTHLSSWVFIYIFGKEIQHLVCILRIYYYYLFLFLILF